jgi:hypothetical protein
MRSIRKTAAATVALAATLLLVLCGSLASPAPVTPPSPEFFGISPQTPLTEVDVEHMQAGRIGSLRWPMGWEAVQPTEKGGFEWASFDEVVKTAALGRMRVLPFLAGTPRWLAHKFTILPIDTGRRRQLWTAFVRAAVERYGPHGDFWFEHRPGTEEPVPKIPVRDWQVWNEANFFYFATPASPTRYAQLLKITHSAIVSVEPGARIILSGLFGDPTAQPPNAMSAVDFLERLYEVPGIKSLFDGVALHPYADQAPRLEEMTEEIRDVIVDNRDPGARLYITEMGWGSQNDPHIVSFERGIRGQVKELRGAYEYLIENRHRLNLKGTYWFSWKDAPNLCNFCDSVGLFRSGARFHPKPAWHAFIDLTGGRARP